MQQTLKMDVVRLFDCGIMRKPLREKDRGETEKDWTVKMNYGSFLSSPAPALAAQTQFPW